MSRKTPLPDDSRVLLALATDYMHVFQYDIDKDETSLVLEFISKDERISRMEDKGFREAFGIYIDNFVLPEDREMMRERFSLPQVMHQVSTNSSYRFEYRNQEGHFCECKMALVWNLDNLLSIGFADIDHQVRSTKELHEEQKKTFDTMRTLISEYSSVGFVSMSDGTVSVYSLHDGYGDDFKKLLMKGISFWKAARIYAGEYVFENDVESFLESVSIENIRQRLLKKKRFDMLHRVCLDGKTIQYAHILIVKIDDADSEPTGFAIAFDYDNDRVINEYMSRNLVNEYQAVFFIDLDNNIIHHHGVSGDVPSEHFISEDCRSKILEYSRTVAPEYRQMFENLADVGFLREYLKEKDIREYCFRASSEMDEWKRCVFQVIDRRNGVPSTLIMSESTIEIGSVSVNPSDVMSMARQNSMLERIESLEQQNRQLESKVSDLQSHVSETFSTDAEIKVRRESISNIVHEMIRTVMPEIERKEILFTVDASRVRDDVVIVDRSCFTHIVLHFLTNGIRFAHRGDRIVMRLVQRSSANPGASMFEINVRESRNESSSSISIDLKTVPCEDGQSPPLEGKKALIVDSDADDCRSLAQILEDLGADVQWCLNGTEATYRAEEASRNGRGYDFILMDRRLRIRTVVEGAAIILTSTYEWSEIGKDGGNAVADGLLVKPIFRNDIVQVLNNCMEKQREE